MYKLLTLLNTITNIFVIVYLFAKFKRIKFSIEKEKSWTNKTLCSISIYYWNHGHGKCLVSLRLKNSEKVKIKEDIERMLSPKYPNKKYDLGAILSCTNDGEEIVKFKQNYGIVDPDYVNEIITKQIAKKGILLTPKQHKIIYG